MHPTVVGAGVPTRAETVAEHGLRNPGTVTLPQSHFDAMQFIGAAAGWIRATNFDTPRIPLVDFWSERILGAAIGLDDHHQAVGGRSDNE